MPEYKYQYFFDENDLQCDCFEKKETIDAFAYRWIINPVNHSNNFIPNFLYDMQRSNPRRINDVTDKFKCGYCALSLFLSKDDAIKKFRGLPVRAQEMIGYDSIAEGQITHEDGVISDLANNHFNLFEYDTCDLQNRFVISASII
jgi:hypothetical protein